MAYARIAFFAALAFGAASFEAGAAGGSATDFSAQTARRTRPYIEIRPDRPAHRECVDGYRQVWRPHWGTYVVMPYMRCWWVRG